MVPLAKIPAHALAPARRAALTRWLLPAAVALCLAGPAMAAPPGGANSCKWADDGQCDEPGIGTGDCLPNTDADDCRPIRTGGNDSCRWARDGSCDERNIGSGLCSDGTDATDCRPLYARRNRTNSCASAFNDICDEPVIGTGRCAARTDTADCLGRDTPAGIRDHFFGRDQRRLAETDRMPWSAIGELTFDNGSCSGTVVGRRVVLTAAHCFMRDDDTLDHPQRFRAGRAGSREVAEARIVSFQLAPGFREGRARGGESWYGLDWALVLLDRDIGDTTGTMAVHRLKPEDRTEVSAGRFPRVMQGGYAWDAPDRMTEHVGCRIVTLRDDNTLLHDCDMTKGDSGSPIFIKQGGGYAIVAVVSRFYSGDGGTRSSYLAVDSRAFETALAKYLAANGG